MKELENIKAIRDAVPNMPKFVRQEIDADIARREKELKSMEDSMPYTEAQHRLFEAAAHDPEVAKRKDIPQATAARLAHEGVKKDNAACADNLTNGTPRKGIKVRFKRLIK